MLQKQFWACSMEDLYLTNKDVYNAVSKITGLKFHKYMKNSGIEMTELLEANSLSHTRSFYILCYEESGEERNFRFKQNSVFIIMLKKIAKDRLKRKEIEHTELLKITDSEADGNWYYNAMEMNAINIESLKGLINYLEEQEQKSHSK